MSGQNLSKEEFERDFDLKDTNWFYKGMSDIWASLLAANAGAVLPVKCALDLGCGVGGKMEHLKKISDKVFGLDLSMDALRFCKISSSSHLTQATIEELPYKNGVFTFVNAFDVLEHVENDIGVLREINRVLADSGFLVIAVPAFNMLWSQHDIANFHKRRYRSAMLKEKVEKAGFKVKRMTYANFFLFPPVLLFRIVQYRILGRISGRSGEAKRTRVEGLPGSLNAILHGILKLESLLIKKVDLPFGVALLCVAEKTGLK